MQHIASDPPAKPLEIYDIDCEHRLVPCPAGECKEESLRLEDVMSHITEEHRTVSVGRGRTVAGDCTFRKPFMWTKGMLVNRGYVA